MTVEPARSPEALRPPSLVPPVVVAALGAAAMVWQLGEVLTASPPAGQARPVAGPLLAAAVALGGFSLTWVLQLLVLAASHASTVGRADAAADRRPPVPHRLVDAHSLHAVWVIGVGASVALMGALGIWSAADGKPSGLEPGWPLLLAGGGIALIAQLARQRITALWESTGDAL